MTRSIVRGRLNPLWLQKQAEKRRLAHTARVNKPKAEVPLLESSQAKASKAKYQAWRKSAKERKRDEAKASREAARKQAEGADLFDAALAAERSGQEDRTARETDSLQETRASPRDKRRKALDRYDELK